MFEVVKLRVRDLAWEKGKTMQRDAMWDNRRNKALRIRKDPWIDRRGERQRGKLQEKRTRIRNGCRQIVAEAEAGAARIRARGDACHARRLRVSVVESKPSADLADESLEIAAKLSTTLSLPPSRSLSLCFSLSLSISLVDSTMDKLAKELDTSKRSNRHATDAPSRPRVDDRLL